MRSNIFKSIPRKAGLAASVLLLASGAVFAQQQVNLTAAPSTASLPDGSAVPMWGYSCGAAVASSTATCTKLNPLASGWSPVVITVPTGQDLTINLTNNLTFGAASLPTSLVIVGQLGGGLGTTATSTPSPDHSGAQANLTWPIAGPASNPGVAPAQGPRVQSFSTEVAAGATTALTWTAPRPGTYLIESGTHPSIQGTMGLYGILVVTSAPTATAAGTAYPGVTYNAEVPLLLSEIDPVQNAAVSAAVNTTGFSETRVWSGQPNGCGNPASGAGVYQTCYPPVVNYTPLYYLFNGVAFDKTRVAASLFAPLPSAAATPIGSNVLVRFVNAGSHMHVPSIVGAQTGTAAAAGMSLIAEDGNPVPGITRVQNEVFMAAGKTYDVMVNAPAAALPVYDRELSLSANAIARDAGMLAYISVNGAAAPTAAALTSAVANPDTYVSVVPGNTLTVSDPAKGVIANDINVYGVKVITAPTKGTLTLNADGTFTYIPKAGWSGGDSFVYQANGNGPTATVTLGAATIEAASGITVNPISYTSTLATSLSIKTPGILSVDSDASGYPLSVVASSVAASSGLTVAVDSTGAFNASVAGPGTYTFSYKAQNSQGTQSATAATVTLVFPPATGLAVTVLDGTDKTTVISDYRWIIEEDRTFYVDPSKTTNSGTSTVPTFGTNFHTSFMPVVATGCTGVQSCEGGQTVLGKASVCDVGDGACRPGAQQTAVNPNQVQLDPSKHYYLSVLPGDAANPFQTGNLTASCAGGGSSANCGHGMGGAPVIPTCTPSGTVTSCVFNPVTVLTQPTPFPPAKLSVFVFEDDFPLNGENDAGGGVDTISPNEPGLGSFNITIMDDAGGPGDATGQVDYDMFNQPLSNSLSGTIDPATGLDACPISKIAQIGAATDLNQTGITGTIVTCPKYEGDGTKQILSPLAGQAVVANMMPGRYGVVATPGADRIARGEEWLQTNTLDGQKAHDSFLRIGEPSFFQEFGPAGYHVSIGFANPAIINGRLAGVCGGTDLFVQGTNCTNTVTGLVTTERMSRTPDERLYSSGSRASFAFTQCYVSFGDPDGEDFAFTKCNPDGTFTMSGLPDGDWRITTFDQWNDQLVDGLSTPVRLTHNANGACGAGSTPTTCNVGDIAANQWQANFYTRTFLDTNKDGVSNKDSNGNPTEPGLALVKTNVRFRDGSFSNRNNTDLNGFAGFNEEFPLFNWYVIETDVTRYKNTGTHVVYDTGGPADGSASCGNGTNFPTCDMNAVISKNLANTIETVPLPTDLRVPGAVYCANADCTGMSIASGPGGPGGSTGRIDPPWVLTEGWQGFSGQNNFLEFGKVPYAAGENGGIRGHVIYSSTRPFDDPQFGTQNVWEPLVPGVTINLYQQSTAPDGSVALKLVDTTKTTSWDDWAQGFRSDGRPNMNCPGQLPAPTSTASGDLFFFSLFNQPEYLDSYNAQHNGGTAHAVPYNSQYKCYDGMHNWNQLQPAPYDGMYQFPSVTGLDPITGKPTGTNCTACVANPDTTDPYRSGTPMLPDGQYVVEVVVPPGYELVKEEDKNILIGDNFIAPVTVQFPGLGSAIYILPDQAQVASSYNANNVQNPTNSLGRLQPLTSHEGDTPTVDTFWPCVGQSRIVPDYISLFPGSHEVAPFAGATRNLCDRKLVTLDDQTSSQAEFFIFTSTHVAAHFAGVITDDFTSEFDPYSPQFGEKFSPPDLPISIKDWTGTEISRVYSDHWGAYNGLTYSTWEVNPPNPTGYSPTMMVTCMNDPGTGATPDPLYNPAYSQFCYEIPFMPGATQYMDTPVVPTSAFAGAGYNNPDCAYPDATPAVSEVDGDGVGPWVSAAGNTLTIKSLGDQTVNNNAYSGPQQTSAPYNQKTITRHYGFGAQCTSTSSTCSAVSNVTIGGVGATITGWSDTQITVTVPGGVPNCAVQQQAQFGGSTAQCGQLSITAGNGKQSIDAVTVTIGGKAPTRIAAGGTLQAALDAAAPGDLIIVPPGNYTEMLLMWKPVRLQGVGAASSVINANTHPAGKLIPWRRQVNCLFGLALDGTPLIDGTGASHPYDPTGQFSCPAHSAVDGATGPNGNVWNYYITPSPNPIVDRLPLEAVVGWDATLNGNLAEQLQEPTLMGAYEGAGITVLSKGVRFTPGSAPFGSDTYPTDATLLNASNCGKGAPNASGFVPNPYPSNFQCNPSSIDGLSVTNASQGGGGIFVHAWGHNLQIANNRVHSNTGTLTGGITIGQGEFPPANIQGGTANAAPGSCQTSRTLNTQLPYCFDLNVNVHNNAVTSNSSIGDELFSSTPAGAGGVTFCTGSDFYKFNYNWLCGNLSSGDGGGFAHMGFSYNGDIEHNAVLFNQSTNPTVPTNGGGLLIMGAPDTDPVCGSAPDGDCAPGASDGAGPGLVINANLIMGNSAESGSGGGIRFQGVNGTDVATFPLNPSNWYAVSVTNNIIANNVGGWDGAGVSLIDALKVSFVNNTVIDNDTTASSGVLFNTIGAPIASASGPTCKANCGTKSLPQPAGLVAVQNSAGLMAVLPAAINCPAGNYAGGNPRNAACRSFSYPLLANNVFWQNRAFYIGVGGLASGTVNQQNVVALYNAFTTTGAASQPQVDAVTANGSGHVVTGGTGACVSPVSYWDIGVRGDTGPANHSGGGGVALAPSYSVITDAGDYPGLHNTPLNPTVVNQYCNGSRIPPELGSMGYQVPPGISDATVPNPVFNLTPAATVDEGNNWINLAYGPLALTNPLTGSVLGNYAPAAGSPVINYIPSSANNNYSEAPSTDFFGNPRKTNKAVDAGAVEFQTAPLAIASVTGGPLAFGNVATGTTSAARTLTLNNTGTANLTGISLAFAPTLYSRAGGTCTATLAPASTCTITVTFSPTAVGAANGTLTITASVAVTGSPVTLTGAGVTPVISAGLTPTSWTISQTRNCPGVGFGQIFCLLDPVRMFTLTNTGNVTLSGISNTLSGTAANLANYANLGSTCGTTLAPGATCVIAVQFKPLTAQAAGLKAITLNVTDSAGTQSAAINGTAQ
jgi:hypothetical protein